MERTLTNVRATASDSGGPDCVDDAGMDELEESIEAGIGDQAADFSFIVHPVTAVISRPA